MLTPNFKLTVNESDKNSAEIHIEPLEKGFGHTLGNALRRVLLTSLDGTAATQVKVDGVNHQFTTLKGLQENIVDLVLNLKGVHFKIEGKSPVTVKLDQKGKKTITAKDLDCPAGVSVTNPDHHLATLTDSNAKLKASVTVDKGLGYVSADEHQTEEVGVIPLDSIFTPVVRASYEVESTRVGRRTDLDKIILKVETNGTISPEEATKRASETLAAYFTQVYNPTFEKVEEIESSSSTLAPEAMVEDLGLSTRITNALKKGGYVKLNDFKGSNRDDLLKTKNLGEKSADDIIKRLAKKGIEVK